MRVTSGPSSAPHLGTKAALVVAMIVLAAGVTARAQLGLPGPTKKALDVYNAVDYNADGVDAAYDPNNDVYLAVAAVNHVTGVWVDHLGVPQAGVAPVPIKPKSVSGTCGSSSKPFGAFARTAYSPQLGGFLVAWSEEEHSNRPTTACGGPATVPANVRVYMRTVKYPATLGPVVRITDSTVRLSFGNLDVAYSETSQRFLIAYTSLSPASGGGHPYRIRVQAVDLGGNRIGGSVQVSGDVMSWAPSVTWNSATNEFGVGYSGEIGNASAFYSGFARVPAANPAGSSRTTFNNPASGQTQLTDINYIPSTGRYLMTWWEPYKARVAEIDAAGVVKTLGTASTVIGRLSYRLPLICLQPV